MKYFKLIRVAPTIDGTLGRMDKWFTMEEEDLDNAQNISSILAGAYVCKRHHSPKFGETFIVTEVPGRAGILFHPFNTEEGTRGCIGLGTDVGFIEVEDEDGGGKMRKLAVLNSQKAHQQFMHDLTGINTFILIVEDFR